MGAARAWNGARPALGLSAPGQADEPLLTNKSTGINLHVSKLSVSAFFPKVGTLKLQNLIYVLFQQ